MDDLNLEIHGRSGRSIHRRGKPRFVCGYRRCGALDCPTCNPGGYEDHQEPVIRTSHDFPPIPDRSFDWSAVTDNYDLGHPIGHGATEAEAIADLKQQIKENEE